MALDVCESSHDLEMEYKDFQWEWVFRNTVQWHAVAVVLTNSLHRFDLPDFSRAWRQIDVVIEKYNSSIQNSGEAVLWKPLISLWREATPKRVENEKLLATFEPFGPLYSAEEFGQIQGADDVQQWNPALFGSESPRMPL